MKLETAKLLIYKSTKTPFVYVTADKSKVVILFTVCEVGNSWSESSTSLFSCQFGNRSYNKVETEDSRKGPATHLKMSETISQNYQAKGTCFSTIIIIIMIMISVIAVFSTFSVRQSHHFSKRSFKLKYEVDSSNDNIAEKISK